MSDEKMQIDITAKDDASKVIDPLQVKVDKLEKSDTTVEVDADTSDAAGDVDSFAKKLAKLSDADQVVVLAVLAGAAQSELTQLATELANIDASDPDVDVKINRYAEVAGQLDDLESKMKDIAGTSLDPDVGDKARTRLAGIGEEAGKTQGAVHGMAGGALGDFAATATGIGPLGEAIGQLTETALEGEAGMKGLATAGLGLGALSAGMFVVNKVMGEFAKTAAKAAEIKAFNTADVDAFTKALTAGKDAADDYVERMTALGKVTTIASGVAGVFAQSFQGAADIAPQLAEAGITMSQFATAVTGSKDDLALFDAAVKATGISVGDQNLIISGAATEADNFAKAQQNAARFAKVFTDSTDDSAESFRRLIRASDDTGSRLGDLGGALGRTEKHQDDLTSATGESTRAFKTQGEQIDDLKGKISDDQAWIDLQDDIDAVKQSGKDAWDAVATGADDAAARVRSHTTDINTLKQSVIDYGTQVLGLPADQVTNIVANVNDEDLDETKKKLDDIRQHNKIVIDFVVNSPSGWYLLGSRTTATGPVGTAAPTQSVVNNYLAAAATGRQLRSTQARYARVNGR